MNLRQLNKNDNNSWSMETLSSLCLALLIVAPQSVRAELAGTTVDLQSFNFPKTGAGQIVLADGKQNLGETGLAVDTQVTRLPGGDELVEFWWSNGQENATTLADDVTSPSMISFALGQPDQPAGVPVQFLLAFTVDGEPLPPVNPFNLPPLNNAGSHPHGHDFDVFIFDGIPPQGPRYDDHGRLQFAMPSGLFAGQTFYNRGNVPPEQGGVPGPFGDVGGLDLFGAGMLKDQVDGIYNAWVIRQVPLQPGDADQDLDFDQFDLIRVQQAAKYLTGKPATWGEGDWNGAPGGGPALPPVGDRLFNQMDIVAANSAGMYLQGTYTAIKPNGVEGDFQTSLVYNVGTGELSVDAPIGQELTSINVTSTTGQFIGAKPAVLDGAFDNFDPSNVFKATFGGSFGSISFGNALPTGIAESTIAADLSAVGSLAGGGDLGQVDLVYVPEPTSTMLLAIGLLMAVVHFRRTNR